MAQTISRETPAAVDSERALLGAVLLDPEQLSSVVEILRPGQRWFYLDAHHRIFDAMLTLFERRDPIDLVSLTDVLHRRGHLEKVGGAVGVAGLLEVAVTTANTAYHARLVREKFTYRSLINLGTQIQTGAYEQDELPAILAQAHQGLLQLSNTQSGGTLSSLEELVQQAIHDAQHADTRDITGLNTGLSELNDKTSGGQPSDLIILAARPGMGKTALAMPFAVAAARMPQSAPVLVFSLEMSQQQLVTRLLCAEARINAQSLRRGGLRMTENGAFMNAGERLHHLPILMDDTTSLSVLDVRTRAKRLQMDRGLALIVIDYLQLMSPLRRRDSRQQEVSDTSRELKVLAKELNVPVLALSQLSRAVETRNEHVPVLSDLRDSGSLEQDADLVMFMYRDGDNPVTQLIISKQRNGPVGEVELIFHTGYARFDASAHEYHHAALANGAA